MRRGVRDTWEPLSSVDVASRAKLKEHGGDGVQILTFGGFLVFFPHPQPSREHPTSWEFHQQDMVQGASGQAHALCRSR